MQNQDESGRSMIEMLAVLSIMGVIMYGAIAGINFGIDMYKINATYNEVEELAQSIVDLYSWNKQTPYSNLNIKTVCDNDAYPTCSNDNQTMTNQWGGRVIVGKRDDGNSFAIVYNSVPSIACERLRTEPGFQNICVDKTTSCNQSSNELTFFLRGDPGCND